MRRPGYFEVCRGEASDKQPWWVRYRSSNGAILFSSENYARQRAAEHAILLLARTFWCDAELVATDSGFVVAVNLSNGAPGVPIRFVDMRRDHA